MSRLTALVRRLRGLFRPSPRPDVSARPPPTWCSRFRWRLPWPPPEARARRAHIRGAVRGGPIPHEEDPNEPACQRGRAAAQRLPPRARGRRDTGGAAVPPGDGDGEEPARGHGPARGAAAGARAPGRRRGRPRGGPGRARDAAGGGPAARSRLRAARGAPEPGLHPRRRRVAGHPDRLQHHDLHDRRLAPVPPAAGRSSGRARGRLHELPRRRAVLDELVSGLRRSARRERRVHGHGRACPDVRGGPGGRHREPGDGRGGDGQLLPVARRSAGAGPDAWAGGRSTRRRPRGGDLQRAVGPGLRTGSGRRGPEPPHPVPAVSRGGCRAARVRRHAAPARPGSVDSDDLDRGRVEDDVLRRRERDEARTPRTTTTPGIRQGKAPRRRDAGTGGREPRRDHGRSRRRRSRFRRGPAGVVDPDGERASAGGNGGPGVRRRRGGPDAGRGRSAGGVRERHGHAAGPRRRAPARDRGAARRRREPRAPRAAVVDGESRPVVSRRGGRADPGLEPAAHCRGGGASHRTVFDHLRVPPRYARFPVHGGVGGRSGRRGGPRAGARRHPAERGARPERRRRGRARRRSPLDPARCAGGGAVGGHGAAAGARGSPS